MRDVSVCSRRMPDVFGFKWQSFILAKLCSSFKRRHLLFIFALGRVHVGLDRTLNIFLNVKRWQFRQITSDIFLEWIRSYKFLLYFLHNDKTVKLRRPMGYSESWKVVAWIIVECSLMLCYQCSQCYQCAINAVWLTMPEARKAVPKILAQYTLK